VFCTVLLQQYVCSLTPHLHLACYVCCLQMGLGDLTDGGPTPKGKYNGGQEPYNEAW
jgi:hypothetical protein